MLRLAAAVTLIATIYSHSPHRPGNDLAAAVSSWAGATATTIAGTALPGGVGPTLADAALRRTITESVAELRPARPPATP